MHAARSSRKRNGSATNPVNLLWCAAAAVAVLYFLSSVALVLRDAGQHAHIGHVEDGNPAPNGRARDALNSAECMRRTGMFLAMFSPDGTKIGPIENAAIGDLGQAALADMIAPWISTPLTLTSLVRINYIVAALGIALLSAALLWSQYFWSGILVLFLGAYYGIPGPIPSADISSGYAGIAAMACVPLVWLLWLHDTPERAFSSVSFWVAAVVSWICLAWSLLLRQPIGMTAIGGSLGLVVWLLVRQRQKGARVVGMYALLGLAVIAASKVPSVLVWTRNRFDHFPPNSLLHVHGFWHTMYTGLGAAANPWGIRWDDHFVYDRVLKLHPGTPIFSQAYFDAVRHEYLAILRSSPLQVLGVYGLKLWQSMTLPTSAARIAGINVFLIVVAYCAAWPLIFLNASPSRRRILKISLIGAFMSLSLLLQGILAKPMTEYLFPAQLMTAWTLASLLELGISSPSIFSKAR